MKSIDAGCWVLLPPTLSHFVLQATYLSCCEPPNFYFLADPAERGSTRTHREYFVQGAPHAPEPSPDTESGMQMRGRLPVW